MKTEDELQAARPWPSPDNFRKSIRREFAIYMGGVVLILMMVTGVIVTRQLVTTVTDNVVEKLLVQARSYAAAAGKNIIAVDGPDALMLTDICRKLTADNQDLGWVGIAAKDGRYLAHSDMKMVISGAVLSSPGSPSREFPVKEGEALAIGRDSISVTVPITEQGVLIGRLALSSSTHQIVAAQKASIVSVIVITLAMVGTGIPLTMFVLSRRLRPVRRITEALRKVDINNLEINLPISTPNEFGYLAETLRVMGNHLELAQKQMVENERMLRELEIAREIQANILPKSFPKGASFEFAGAYQSAKEVGGDYYDFIDLGHDRLGILIADVSGKSLPGMLVMLITRDLVMRHARTCIEPATFLSRVNRDLRPEIRKGMFVTMFYGVLDNSNGTFTFASAGHNPLIHVSGQGQTTELIKTKGFPLGLMDSDHFEKRVEQRLVRLAPGDWLIQYTDGINEAMNASQEEFGLERFVGSIRSSIDLGANGLVQHVLSQVSAFVGPAPQSDDVTLVTMKWLGVSSDITQTVLGEGTYAVNRREPSGTSTAG